MLEDLRFLGQQLLPSKVDFQSLSTMVQGDSFCTDLAPLIRAAASFLPTQAIDNSNVAQIFSRQARGLSQDSASNQSGSTTTLAIALPGQARVANGSTTSVGRPDPIGSIDLTALSTQTHNTSSQTTTTTTGTSLSDPLTPTPAPDTTSPITVNPTPTTPTTTDPTPTTTDPTTGVSLSQPPTSDVANLPAPTSTGSITQPSTPVINSPLLSISQLTFSGLEGASGTFQVHLNQAPTAPITLTLSPGNFLSVDADNNLQNGTQTTLTFTADNWNQAQTVWFMAEDDGVATDRTTGNTISYTLSGGSTETGSYDVGVVKNTYAPDPARFNIDLDFRNDTTGFWTEARRAIAQQAADTWASYIANEWSGFQINSAINQVGNDGNYTGNTFSVNRYVDDLVVFVNTINTSGSAGGYGLVDYNFGGWFTSPELQPRVGQIAIDPAVGDAYLYNAVLHELGHTLGLVGLNWDGFLQQNLSSPQTAVFNGLYSTAANGGNPIPLQSQDGANPVTGAYDYWHPANSVYSAMSYGSIYSVSGPTPIDLAMLADSGYQVYGVNTPALTTSTTPASSTVSAPSTTIAIAA